MQEGQHDVHDAGHQHPEHLEHHFDTPTQQFDASKLGMWLFLATEILLFGGLFCAYAVYRASRPEIFIWAHHMLDKNLGAVNTVVLLCSSLTMAWAVRSAQLGQKGRLVLLLALTFLGGCGFMGIKFVEYQSKWKHGLLWARSFDPDQHYVAHHFGLVPEEAAEGGEAGTVVADVELGKILFESTCKACHGTKGQGVAKQGASMRDSKFIADKTDEELLAFLKVGRQSFDPASTMKIMMPPRGGNPTLSDDKLVHVIAYARVLQEEYQASVEAAGGEDVLLGQEEQVEEEFALERSVIPAAFGGPVGLQVPGAALLTAEEASAAPQNAQTFFSIYFLMTGLHGLHVLAGMIVLAWLLVRALRGQFSRQYFTPVDLGGLYWHLVDLIWIFLFPLLYLIH